MEIRKTSFGQMSALLHEGRRPLIEWLSFEKDGRAHQHKEYESFFVLKGSGKIYSGETIYDVKEGDLVTIPPETQHWMEPSADGMEGFLWYHDKKLINVSNQNPV